MRSGRIMISLLWLALLATLPATGQTQPATSPPPHLSRQTRMQLINLLSAELVYARTPFPMGQTGLKLKEGVVTPHGEELRQLLAMWGPAVKTGDPARITDVIFKPNYVRLEINGGPIHKQKWYQHITIEGASGPAAAPSDPKVNARGSFVDVYFDPYVPEMTGRQFKEILRPVLDFDAKSPLEAFLDSVPPKVKEAIQNHQVLVGMNRDMVTYSKGRPPKKIREREGEVEYEEWIYGEPPQDVDFVRFVGDEVVRLEIMKVDGEKIVKSEKEVNLEPASSVAKETQSRPANAPTLRRPGEQPDPASRPSTGSSAPVPAPAPSPDPGSTPPNWSPPA